jgi:hypothetical protein
MRSLRVLTVVAAVATGCVFSFVGPASAQVTTRLAVGPPHLVGKGAEVRVRLTATCDPSLNIAFGDVSVTQVSGHKLASGTGFFSNDFPGVPCTGSAQVVNVTVPSSTSFAFKKGSATESAELFTYNPVTGDLVPTAVGPRDVRIIS